jgi:GH24 family phage-related lysozyme (muramidase)
VPDKTLVYGMSDPAVITLKKLLYDRGYRDFSSTDDGQPSSNRFNSFYGKYTKDTVQRFQRDKGMSPDGVVGPTTWRKLRGTATRLSSEGLDFILDEEGFVPYAYNDPAGHATFGVGHLIHLGPVTAADRTKWGTKTFPKTRAFVMEVFAEDVDKYEDAVRESVKVDVSQKMFDAMVSLAYNIGTGGFRSSSVVRRLNAGDRSGAANAFLLWDAPSMLRPRRERERALFLGGQY